VSTVAESPAAPPDAGVRMHELATELFPICRSITGEGVRETLHRLARLIPLEQHEVPSGTQVLDWTIPDEWNITDAYVADPSGRRVIDFRASNLHVVGYSEPVRETMTLTELRPRLHTHLENPSVVPYRTSYYNRTWGFCLSQERLASLGDGLYDVAIDSTLAPGSLTYGECFLPGQTTEEVLVSAHVCHPSLANDNLSGIVVATELAAALARTPRRLSYRFLFVPGTIGSIAWLARNEDVASCVVAGLVVACVGDPGPLTYKRSRRRNALVDRAGEHVVGRHAGGRVLDFVPWGWDERQYNSPGFDLPVGCLTRSLEGEFPQYHSSADDLELITPSSLAGALEAALGIAEVLEHDRRYVNLSPKGEPQLGKRGLYRGVGGPAPEEEQLALLWVLNQSDGAASLLDIAERSGLSFSRIHEAAGALTSGGLLAESDGAR
jgi:aminopeptidase-like protein